MVLHSESVVIQLPFLDRHRYGGVGPKESKIAGAETMET